MPYREFGSALADVVACTWERRVSRADAAATTRVLPDGCVDLLWRGGELLVAGPDTEPFVNPLAPGETIVGLRLRPGVAGSALGLPASELRNTRVELAGLWGRRAEELAERIGEASAPERARGLLEQAVAACRHEPDPLVREAMRMLGRPGTRVRALSRLLGVSERQLRRRFDAAVGYGPKTLDRVLRFRRLLARAPAVAAHDEQLGRLAFELGYADQAHLTRECVRLSGLTPSALVRAV